MTTALKLLVIPSGLGFVDHNTVLNTSIKSNRLRNSSKGGHSLTIPNRIGTVRRQAIVASASNNQPETPPWVLKTALKVALLLPLTGIALGIHPRSAEARAQPLQTSETVIDPETGMPKRWVYSAERWSQDRLDAIYSFYKHGAAVVPSSSSGSARSAKAINTNTTATKSNSKATVVKKAAATPAVKAQQQQQPKTTSAIEQASALLNNVSKQASKLASDTASIMQTTSVSVKASVGNIMIGAKTFSQEQVANLQALLTALIAQLDKLAAAAAAQASQVAVKAGEVTRATQEWGSVQLQAAQGASVALATDVKSRASDFGTSLSTTVSNTTNSIKTALQKSESTAPSNKSQKKNAVKNSKADANAKKTTKKVVIAAAAASGSSSINLKSPLSGLVLPDVAGGAKRLATSAQGATVAIASDIQTRVSSFGASVGSTVANTTNAVKASLTKPESSNSTAASTKSKSNKSNNNNTKKAAPAPVKSKANNNNNKKTSAKAATAAATSSLPFLSGGIVLPDVAGGAKNIATSAGNWSQEQVTTLKNFYGSVLDGLNSQVAGQVDGKKKSTNNNKNNGNKQSQKNNKQASSNQNNKFAITLPQLHANLPKLDGALADKDVQIVVSAVLAALTTILLAQKFADKISTGDGFNFTRSAGSYLGGGSPRLGQYNRPIEEMSEKERKQLQAEAQRRIEAAKRAAERAVKRQQQSNAAGGRASSTTVAQNLDSPSDLKSRFRLPFTSRKADDSIASSTTTSTNDNASSSVGGTNSTASENGATAISNKSTSSSNNGIISTKTTSSTGRDGGSSLGASTASTGGDSSTNQSFFSSIADKFRGSAGDNTTSTSAATGVVEEKNLGEAAPMITLLAFAFSAADAFNSSSSSSSSKRRKGTKRIQTSDGTTAGIEGEEYEYADEDKEDSTEPDLLDILLAPVAPLIASLPEKNEVVSSIFENGAKYDMIQDLLRADAEEEPKKKNKGRARFDMIGDILRGE